MFNVNMVNLFDQFGAGARHTRPQFVRTAHTLIHPMMVFSLGANQRILHELVTSRLIMYNL